MSRFADALKRARTGAVAAPSDEDRSGEAFRFFAPGQPAVVAPWEIGHEPPVASAVDPPQPRAATERHSVPRFPDRDDAAPARARLSSGRRSEKLITSPTVAAIVREQYNKLAATLHQLQLERQLKVLMITSAVPHEGKTLTAANLALTLSESYHRRVLLIDGDLRHPSAHTNFGVSNARGLSDSLSGHGPLPLVQVSSRLFLLPAGSGSDDPMKTLTSDRMRMLVEEARADFDWVLFDTAPIGLLPDAGLLASMTDGALFVALARRTAYDEIQRAVEAVGTDRILGVVLNGIAETDLPPAYYADYYRALQR